MDNYYSDQFNYCNESSAYGDQSYGIGTGADQQVATPGDQIYASRNENDSRKIFVGGLSWETTSDDLYQYFQQFGDVVDVNLKVNPATNESRGFGFVLFSDEAAVDKIVDCPSHVLHGRTIDPKRAMAEGSRELNSKVFVGGIDPQMSKEEITETFNKFGRIEQIELPYDKVKNERRAFAFITFESEEVADRVCRNRKVTCGKRKVDVKRVYTKDHKPPPDVTTRVRGPSMVPPNRAPAAARSRGYVDPDVYQTNGMYRSGCSEEDDEFSVLQGAFNTIAAVASGYNLPAMGGRGVGRPPYPGQGHFGPPGRQNAPGRGGPPSRGGAAGHRGAGGRGFHPYNR